VLELGAGGGGLPGGHCFCEEWSPRGLIHSSTSPFSMLICIPLVVLTDYPDSDLIDNLEHNVLKNIGAASA